MKKFLRLRFILPATVTLLSSGLWMALKDADAFYRDAPSNFAEAGGTESIVFKRDDTGSLEAFRKDTDADSISLNGICFDLTFQSGFTISSVPLDIDIQVFDELGCESNPENSVLEQGNLSCTNTPAAAEEFPDIPEEDNFGEAQALSIRPLGTMDILNVNGTAPSGWTNSMVSGHRIWAYRGKSQGLCDTNAGITSRINVKETADFKINILAGMHCEEDCDPPVDNTGVCIAIDGKEPIPILAKTFSNATAKLNTEVRIEAGSHDITLYPAYERTFVREASLTPIYENNEIFRASLFNEGGEGCSFAETDMEEDPMDEGEEGDGEGQEEESFTTPSPFENGVNDEPRDPADFPLDEISCDSGGDMAVLRNVPPELTDDILFAATEENYALSPVTVAFKAGHEPICHNEGFDPSAFNMGVTVTLPTGDSFNVPAFFMGAVGTPACTAENAAIGIGSGTPECECGDVWGARFLPEEGASFTVTVNADESGTMVTNTFSELIVEVSEDTYAPQNAFGQDILSYGILRESPRGYMQFENFGINMPYIAAGFSEPLNLLEMLTENGAASFEAAGQQCNYFDYARHLGVLGISAHALSVPFTAEQYSAVHKVQLYSMVSYLLDQGVVPHMVLSEDQAAYETDIRAMFEGLNAITWSAPFSPTAANQFEVPVGMTNDESIGSIDADNIVGQFLLPMLKSGATGLLVGRSDAGGFSLPWNHFRSDALTAMITVSDAVEEVIGCFDVVGASSDALEITDCVESDASHCIRFSVSDRAAEMSIDSATLEVTSPMQASGACDLLTNDGAEVNAGTGTDDLGTGDDTDAGTGDDDVFIGDATGSSLPDFNSSGPEAGPNGQPGPECTSDSDCPDNLLCDIGEQRCVVTQQDIGEWCETDINCAGDAICNDGQCTE